jgi:hypothetical protein
MYELFCHSGGRGIDLQSKNSSGITKELGGKAKTREISNLAKIKYPESCLNVGVSYAGLSRNIRPPPPLPLPLSESRVSIPISINHPSTRLIRPL